MTTPQIDLRRVFLVAARMATTPEGAGQARHIIALACKAIKGGDENASRGNTLDAINAAPTVQSAGAAHYARRKKFIDRMQSSCDRVFAYAKHETLRNIETHFRENPPIQGAEDSDPKPTRTLAARLAFERKRLAKELLAALREDSADALKTAGQALFDELERDDPFTMPSKDAIAFLDTRENLLQNVPDEMHSEIVHSIQEGIDRGESRREIMKRVAIEFDGISKGRAEAIANTETAAAFNYARDKAMRAAGVTHKKWLHSRSPEIQEPRETHVENDGQVRPIDKPFNISGVKFMHPGDDSLGAGPEDIINCHCVAIPFSK